MLLILALLAVLFSFLALVAAADCPTTEEMEAAFKQIEWQNQRLNKLFDLYSTLNGNCLSTFKQAADTAGSHKQGLGNVQRQIDELRQFLNLEHYIKTEISQSTGQHVEAGLRKVKKCKTPSLRAIVLNVAEELKSYKGLIALKSVGLEP